MYSVYIGHNDYDCPYAWYGTDKKEFATIKEAIDYCEEKSSRRDKYYIDYVRIDGKSVDWRVVLLTETESLEQLKNNVLDQFKKHIDNVSNVSSVEELNKLTTCRTYIGMNSK